MVVVVRSVIAAEDALTAGAVVALGPSNVRAWPSSKNGENGCINISLAFPERTQEIEQRVLGNNCLQLPIKTGIEKMNI